MWQKYILFFLEFLVPYLEPFTVLLWRKERKSTQPTNQPKLFIVFHIILIRLKIHVSSIIYSKMYRISYKIYYKIIFFHIFSNKIVRFSYIQIKWWFRCFSVFLRKTRKWKFKKVFILILKLMLFLSKLKYFVSVENRIRKSNSHFWVHLLYVWIFIDQRFNGPINIHQVWYLLYINCDNKNFCGCRYRQKLLVLYDDSFKKSLSQK